MSNDLVTIIGDSYFEPICTLLERLECFKEDRSDAQSGFHVNGYSASICLLAVACLESYVMRVRAVHNASQGDIDRAKISVYLKKIYPDFPYGDEVREIYILRDVIIHNHLWEVKFNWNDECISVVDANKRSSGNGGYATHVDTLGRKTKTLGLTVNPIKVGKAEVHKVLQVMWKVLIFLENKDSNQCYVSASHYQYKRKMVRFSYVVGLPETAT